MPEDDERLKPYLVHIGNCGAIDVYPHPQQGEAIKDTPISDPTDMRCICGLRQAYMDVQTDIVEWKRIAMMSLNTGR